jgi:hypothetical protein
MTSILNHNKTYMTHCVPNMILRWQLSVLETYLIYMTFQNSSHILRRVNIYSDKMFLFFSNFKISGDGQIEPGTQQWVSV